MRLLLLALVIVVFIAGGIAGADTVSAVQSELNHDFGTSVDIPPPPWTSPLMPIFQAAAAKYDVPLPLLLAIGNIGSAFENRGAEPTIEGGYGVMALRKNDKGGNSLSLAATITGVSEDTLKTDPAANINAAAAVLNYYARMWQMDRSQGLQSWLQPVITYAGLDEEDSKFFAWEIMKKLKGGLDRVNSAGERFQFDPQDIGSVDLPSLVPSGVTTNSPDYGPAIWDPAASCNYSSGTHGNDTVVVHTMEGSLAGTRSWFKNCKAQCSSQYGVGEDGTVVQFVRENQYAWHAGCYNGRSIGIEHEGYASSPSHPQALYNASALLTRSICDRWGIPKQKNTVGPGIIGHIDVTRCCCGTHTDPGNGWDWSYYIGQVRGTPPPPAWAASYRGQSYPATMVAGTTATAWVEYTNNGTGHWTHSATYLGTQGPQDRSSPFCNTPNWTGCNRPTDVDQSDVAQGQVGRFTFILKAPMSAGTYVEKFKLVQEGVAWFGDEITWTITVTPSKGNITGTVRNSFNGQPIAGATVAISGGPSTTTNGSGTYTFANIDPGTYTLNISAPGFSSAADTASVTAGQTTTKDFTLTYTDTTPPTAPSGLSAASVSPTQINLSWSGSTDNGGAGLAGYIVYRGGVEIGRTGATGFQDNGLTGNTSYNYYIKAYDNAGNVSDVSNTVSATTQPAAVPIFQDGFVNTDYWQAIVQSPMTGPNPPLLVSNHNRGIFNGGNSLQTQANGQGCLMGHTFSPGFAAAKFESWFFDGTGLGYMGEFERDSDGWAAYPNSWTTNSAPMSGGVSGNCLQSQDGGWTAGAYKEFTSGFSVGETYTFSMWSKWPAGKSYNTAPVVFVRFRDGAGNTIGTDNTAAINPDGNWHQYNLTGTIPANTASIWVGHWGSRGATETFNYYADSAVFTTSNDVRTNLSRQGLEVRCLDTNGGIKAIYYVGTYGSPPGAKEKYSAGYYKVCGSGCTGWYWPLAQVRDRAPGWHKFAIDFQPYTGAGNEVRVYIDDSDVGTMERTLDTQTYGLNMVAYGYHYQVNVSGWFDDCAMYAAQPLAPTMGLPSALSTSAIRWNLTDNSNNEIGFKIQDASQATKASASVSNGVGGSVFMDETNLAPNTPYTRFAKAFNGTLDSSPSANATRWTLSVPPSSSTVTSDVAPGAWTSSAITFTAVGGFGLRTVAKYRWAWDTNPTHTWTGSEPIWNSGSLITDCASAGAYYLHVIGCNGEDVPNGSLDLGPFNYSATRPKNPTTAIETHGTQNGVWQSSASAPSFTWTGASADAGIAGYLVYFGQDQSGTSTNLVDSAAYSSSAVSTGTYYLRICTKDTTGNDAGEWATLFTFNYDGTAPDTPQVFIDGPYSGSKTTLHASWFASDAESGVTEYSYAIGTTPGGSDALGWTSAGSTAEARMTIPEPGLSVGTDYYISVKAKNGADLWSDPGSSGAFQVANKAATISEAKGLADTTPVALERKIVTSSFVGSYYIEEADRASGILVMGPGPDRGAVVTVGGLMGLGASGERAILIPVTVVELDADANRIPGPLFMPCCRVGGGGFNPYTRGADGSNGLNNVGLLIKVFGKVGSLTGDDFTLDDGSRNTPIRVLISGSDIGDLQNGDFASVAGISSLVSDDGVRKPAVLLVPGGVTKF